MREHHKMFQCMMVMPMCRPARAFVCHKTLTSQQGITCEYANVDQHSVVVLFCSGGRLQHSPSSATVGEGESCTPDACFNCRGLSTSSSAFTSSTKRAYVVLCTRSFFQQGIWHTGHSDLTMPGPSRRERTQSLWMGAFIDCDCLSDL